MDTLLSKVDLITYVIVVLYLIPIFFFNNIYGIKGIAQKLGVNQQFFSPINYLVLAYFFSIFAGLKYFNYFSLTVGLFFYLSFVYRIFQNRSLKIKFIAQNIILFIFLNLVLIDSIVKVSPGHSDTFNNIQWLENYKEAGELNGYPTLWLNLFIPLHSVEMLTTNFLVYSNLIASLVGLFILFTVTNAFFSSFIHKMMFISIALLFTPELIRLVISFYHNQFWPLVFTIFIKILYDSTRKKNNLFTFPLYLLILFVAIEIPLLLFYTLPLLLIHIFYLKIIMRVKDKLIRNSLYFFCFTIFWVIFANSKIHVRIDNILQINWEDKLSSSKSNFNSYFAVLMTDDPVDKSRYIWLFLFFCILLLFINILSKLEANLVSITKKYMVVTASLIAVGLNFSIGLIEPNSFKGRYIWNVMLITVILMTYLGINLLNKMNYRIQMLIYSVIFLSTILVIVARPIYHSRNISETTWKFVVNNSNLKIVVYEKLLAPVVHSSRVLSILPMDVSLHDINKPINLELNSTYVLPNFLDSKCSTPKYRFLTFLPYEINFVSSDQMTNLIELSSKLKSTDFEARKLNCVLIYSID